MNKLSPYSGASDAKSFTPRTKSKGYSSNNNSKFNLTKALIIIKLC